MVNYYDKKRFISKSTLARLADVSPRTFSRYLASRREILKIFGVTPKAQKLPPYAVRYICEDYCIDLPPELQDQQALNASPIRDIILKSWEEEQNFKKNSDCRTKSDSALPRCSTFAMSKGEQGRIANSNTLKRS
jgi:hypothetical protein